MTGKEFWLSKESHNGEGPLRPNGPLRLSKITPSSKEEMKYSNLYKEVS
jgi:hypothetical protein